MLPISMMTAALLALWFIWLAFRVIRLRRQYQVSTGDGGHSDLVQAIRAHGNFSEYVPISLILLILAELDHGHPLILGGLAVLICLGRVFHSIAFLGSQHDFSRRVLGMQFTFFAMAGLAFYDVGLVVAHAVLPLGG